MTIKPQIGSLVKLDQSVFSAHWVAIRGIGLVLKETGRRESDLKNYSIYWFDTSQVPGNSSRYLEYCELDLVVLSQ